MELYEIFKFSNFPKIIFYSLYIMNNQFISNLEKKSKMGWACYYRAVEKFQEKEVKYLSYIQELQQETKKEEVDITFLTNQMKEMMDLLKIETECPICLETIAPKDVKITYCGHKYCSSCLKKIDKCALCKKKIYKKN